MIKVIKYGKRRATCKECRAILEFDKEDIKAVQTGMIEFEWQIVCPVCQRDIKVDR